MRGFMVFLCAAMIAGLAMSTFAVAADLAVVVHQVQAPVQANVVNPYELLNSTREQLAVHFPNMPAAELDKLVFKIADINSMRTLPR